MKISKWILALALVVYAGCTPKTNDGLTPNQPGYTGTGLPNPLVLYNGIMSTGVSLAPPYLPAPYNAGLTINFGDTSVTPKEGTANILWGVTSFNPTGNAVTSTFVGYGLVPASGGTLDLSSGGYTNAIFDAMVTAPASGVTEIIDFAAAGSSGQAITFVTPSAWAPQTVALGLSQTAISQLFVVTFNNSLTSGTTAPVSLYIDNLRFQ